MSWLQILNLVFHTYLWSLLTVFPIISEIYKFTGNPKLTKVRSVNFVVFVAIFAKNGQLHLRFSPWRKKIFDFSGRFSESSNDELSAVLQGFWAYLIASGCKMASKQRGFRKQRKTFFELLMTSWWRHNGRFPTLNIMNQLV